MKAEANVNGPEEHDNCVQMLGNGDDGAKGPPNRAKPRKPKPLANDPEEPPDLTGKDEWQKWANQTVRILQTSMGKQAVVIEMLGQHSKKPWYSKKIVKEWFSVTVSIVFPIILTLG